MPDEEQKNRKRRDDLEGTTAAAADDGGDDGGTDARSLLPKKKRKMKNAPLPDIPLQSAHYHVSWMHANVITRVVTSEKYGMVVTGDTLGIVKFWKRLKVQKNKRNNKQLAGSLSSSKPDAAQQQHPCLEFVKSFTAHPTAVQALEMDPSGDVCVSISSSSSTGSSLLKFYDVATFDAVSMIRIDDKILGQAVASWCISGGKKCFAVSTVNNSEICIFDEHELLHVVKLHAAPVTSLVKHPSYPCILSADVAGTLDLWDVDDKSLGGVCNQSRHGIAYGNSKMDTDLYTLQRKKTYAISMAASSTHYALYCHDHRLRILEHRTGNMIMALDERISAYDKIYTNKPFELDSIEYGKRAATEREIQSESTVFSNNTKDSVVGQQINLVFDPTGRYLLLPCLFGIKVLDWKKPKLAGVVGKADAGNLRFVSLALAFGDAKVDTQMQLARGSANAAINSVDKEEEEAEDSTTAAVVTDTLVVALAYNQRRLYVFSHIDPVQDPKAPDDILQIRDVWNEAPTASDQLYDTTQKLQKEDKFTKAILRTTMGDIHIQLFTSHNIPKTLENFIGHCQSGYYDNVIFHRVISGFMLQTGDPLGDGTGGESIWGGEFEDEIVPGLRHDRPFTVSSANAGPNTNGSQFFITTVPCPWLDGKHTVFGRVVRGMDVCTEIEKVKTDQLDKPLDDVRIHNVDLEQ